MYYNFHVDQYHTITDPTLREFGTPIIYEKTPLSSQQPAEFGTPIIIQSQDIQMPDASTMPPQRADSPTTSISSSKATRRRFPQQKRVYNSVRAAIEHLHRGVRVVLADISDMNLPVQAVACPVDDNMQPIGTPAIRINNEAGQMFRDQLANLTMWARTSRVVPAYELPRIKGKMHVYSYRYSNIVDSFSKDILLMCVHDVSNAKHISTCYTNLMDTAHENSISSLVHFLPCIIYYSVQLIGNPTSSANRTGPRPYNDCEKIG